MLASSLSDNTRLVLATNGYLTSTKSDELKRCRELVLRSVQRKFGDLPEEANRFERFEGFDGRVRAERVQLSDLDIWALRFSEPDKSVPGRDWIVDIATMSKENVAGVSCRLSCYSALRNFSFAPSTPGALKEIVGALNMHNHGYVFPPDPLEIGLDASVDEVLRQLVSPTRWWNIIVVADSEDPRHGFDAAEIQRTVMGCAVVFRLPVELEGEFSSVIGNEYRVFGGAARTYRPGFSDRDGAEEHPVLRSPPFKKRWMMERGNLILATDAFRSSVSRTNVGQEAPSFVTVRQIGARQRALAAKSLGSDELIEALKQQIAAEQEQAEAGLQLAIQEQENRKLIEGQLETEQAANFRLKSKIQVLEASLGATKKPSVQQSLPKNYSDLAAWVQTEYAGRLSLHSRAIKALKSAQYHEITHITDGLDVLANEYRGARLGGNDKLAFEQRLSSLGFQESKSASKSMAGKQGDQYFVVHGGRKQFLERHLKKGNSKDATYCLRIYFFFDENTEEVVVGYLPDHLDTLST